MPKELWIEVFKVGTHTDAAGNTKEWTVEDLDTIVEKYNNQLEDTKHEAPVVIGHPADNSPAYGWVEKLKREGAVLLAKLKDLAPEFIEWVEKGLYKKRSISLYPDLLLKHIGFLGGVPPAVKGLADPNFKNETKELILIEFEDVVPATTQSQKQSIDNKQVNKKINKNKKKEQNYTERSKIFMDEEKFNLLLSDLITFLSETFGEEVANQTNGFLDSNREKYLQAIPSSAAEPKAEPEYKEDPRVKELELQIAKLQKANREKDFKQYVEKLVKEEGKLLPKQMDYAMAILELAYQSGKHQFTEEGKLKEVDALSTVQNFLESFEKKVDLNPIAESPAPSTHNYVEFAGMNVDEDRLAMDAKVQQYIEEQAKQGKVVNYLDAFKMIIKKEKESK